MHPPAQGGEVQEEDGQDDQDAGEPQGWSKLKGAYKRVYTFCQDLYGTEYDTDLIKMCKPRGSNIRAGIDNSVSVYVWSECQSEILLKPHSPFRGSRISWRSWQTRSLTTPRTHCTSNGRQRCKSCRGRQLSCRPQRQLHRPLACGSWCACQATPRNPATNVAGTASGQLWQDKIKSFCPRTTFEIVCLLKHLFQSQVPGPSRSGMICGNKRKLSDANLSTLQWLAQKRSSTQYGASPLQRTSGASRGV